MAMTRETAIRILSGADEKYQQDDLKEACEMGCDALKAQEPVPPVFDGKWRRTLVWECGVCGHVVSCQKDYHPRFCANCGHAVKWP